jgi:hypothetical protein
MYINQCVYEEDNKRNIILKNITEINIYLKIHDKLSNL